MEGFHDLFQSTGNSLPGCQQVDSQVQSHLSLERPLLAASHPVKFHHSSCEPGLSLCAIIFCNLECGGMGHGSYALGETFPRRHCLEGKGAEKDKRDTLGKEFPELNLGCTIQVCTYTPVPSQNPPQVKIWNASVMNKQCPSSRGRPMLGGYKNNQKTQKTDWQGTHRYINVVHAYVAEVGKLKCLLFAFSCLSNYMIE